MPLKFSISIQSERKFVVEFESPRGILVENLVQVLTCSAPSVCTSISAGYSLSHPRITLWTEMDGSLVYILVYILAYIYWYIYIGIYILGKGHIFGIQSYFGPALEQHMKRISKPKCRKPNVFHFYLFIYCKEYNRSVLKGKCSSVKNGFSLCFFKIHYCV